MRHCFGALFLLLSTITVAQGDCSYETQEVDRITKKQHVATKANDWHISTQPVTHFVYHSGSYRMEFLPRTGSVGSIADGAPITFLFTTDSTLVLNQMGFQITDQIGAYWMIDTDMRIDRAQLQFFASNPISMVRVQLTDGYMDFDIKPNQAYKIQVAAQCLLEAVPPE